MASDLKASVLVLHFSSATCKSMLYLPTKKKCYCNLGQPIGHYRALSKLDVSNNNLTRGKLKANTEGFSSDYWGTQDGHFKTEMSGVLALSEVLKR